MSKRELCVIISCLLLLPVIEIVEYVYFRDLPGPDLTMVLSCAVGWAIDIPVSSLAGFSVGLFEDVFSGRIIGLSALSLTVTSAFTSWIRRRVSVDVIFSKSIAALISSIVGDFVGYISLRSLGVSVDFSYFCKTLLLYTSMWSFFLIIPFEFILQTLSNLILKLWPGNKEGKAGRYRYEPNV